MIPLFVEGVRSSVLACSFALLAPAVVLALLSGRRLRFALSVYALGVAVAAAARFGVVEAAPFNLGRAEMGTTMFVLGLAVAWLKRSEPWGPGVGAAALAVSSAWWWQPCVGLHFGATLNRLPTEWVAASPDAIVYATGVVLPVWAAVAAVATWPKIAHWLNHRVALWSGLGVGVLMAAAMLIGRYSSLLGTLFRLSNNT